MMQQVASVKSEVAAFAALQGGSEQQETNLAFEQVLQQQQNTAAITKPNNANAASINDDATPLTKESNTAQGSRGQISNPVKEGGNTADAVEKNAVNTQLQAQQKSDGLVNSKVSNKQNEQQSKSIINAAQTTKRDETELNGNSDEQSLAKSTEQWIDLIWRLQDLSLADEQTTPADVVSLDEIASMVEIVSSDEIANLQDLKVWLEPIEDKLQALTELIEQQPEIKSWLAGADVSKNDELYSLISQVMPSSKDSGSQAETGIDKQNMSLDLAQKSGQKPIVAEGVTAISDNIKQDLLQVSEDIAELLKNNGLNSSEIQLVKQALAQNLSQNKPVDQEIKDLLQAKLTSSPHVDAELGNKGKVKLNEMPIVVVTQKEEAGSNLEANEGKQTSPVQAANKDLQALLDEITDLNNKTETDIKTKADKQVISATDVLTNQFVEHDKSATQVNKDITVSIIESSGKSASPLQNDKVSLSKDSAIANNQAASKAESAAAVSLISNDEIKALVNLSNEELDVALNAVAQRIAVVLRDEAKSQTSLPSKVTSELAYSSTTSGKDILAALRAGVAEFKEQLAAGHEPGLDLKALVAQALEKTGDGAVVAKVAEGLDKSIRTLSQSLAALNQINESSISQAMNTAAIDGQVTQAEQHKTMQLNQFDNKLDKAVNLHKPEGHQQLADKVRWMVNTSNLMAEVRLDPAELGSVHVKVSLSAESATVNFVVQSQQTRDALEAATPKLREMLAEKGIELGQSTVKQDNQSKQDSQGQSGQQAKNGSGLVAGEPMSEDETSLMNHSSAKNGSSGLIDYFV